MLTTAESVERICASAKALLCLDACAVLDIARDPTRDKFSGGHASAAVELLGRAESAPPGLSLLMNMTVRDEISTNLDQVEAESGRRLERLDAAMRRTVGVLKAVGVSLLDAPPQLSDLQFPVAARLVVQRFLNAAHVVEDDADSKVRAIDRVGRGIAPASRAKQSAKDCLIVETYLQVARGLRAAGFTEKIVLLTTNTSDFTTGSPSQPHADLIPDFAAVGMSLATDFLMARYAF